jgi:hypothetical protein
MPEYRDAERCCDLVILRPVERRDSRGAASRPADERSGRGSGGTWVFPNL